MVAQELSEEERRKLARDLLPEILSELENALFALQERQPETERDQAKALIRESLLEVLWEVEQHAPDPDVGQSLRPEVIERLRTAKDEHRVSLEDVKRDLDA